MSLESLEKILQVKFKDSSILKRALTHPSLGKTRPNYERLEFLGDSVLGLIISAELFTRYPEEAEGELTKRLAGLICGDTLVEVSQHLGLGEHILMSASERNSGGIESKTNLENVMEAIIGAIYLDQGFEAAKKFVLQEWEILINKMVEPPKDAKSSLQEWAQGRGLPLPDYVVVSQDGPSHAPDFKISVTVEGFPAEIGTGTSKREAEQKAAAKLFAVLRE